jgi:hypothetical protein
VQVAVNPFLLPGLRKIVRAEDLFDERTMRCTSAAACEMKAVIENTTASVDRNIVRLGKGVGMRARLRVRNQVAGLMLDD